MQRSYDLKRLALKALAAMIFAASLCAYIACAEQEPWGGWYLLFIYIAVPLNLLFIKDLLVCVMPRWLAPEQVLLHVCAMFAAVLGYGLGLLSHWSGIEGAPARYVLTAIFPLVVYGVPLLMVLHGVPVSLI